jgi:S-adenosylmethionine-diacylglycerol 3-amino-3-carboxypropyl transferase
MKTNLQKVDFNFIRYANCWEDADVLLKGLDPKQGARILSVCSAGDNSFSLLSTGAELVVAVDVNKVQLHLAELKRAAFRKLRYEEFLALLGFSLSDRREALYNKIKNELSTEAVIYWAHNIDKIKAGVIHAGKFENYFRLYRSRILNLIHTESRIESLFAKKSAEEQRAFYFAQWNNLRWRMLFKLFFNRYVMGKYGRDPEFLKEVRVPVSRFIFDMAEKHLSGVQAQDNYFLKFIHTGRFENELPHYARKANFEAIKNNIDNLVLLHGFAEKALARYKTISHMNLSNIFEYMNPSLFRETSEKLTGHLATDGKIAYWNLMVHRKTSDINTNKMIFLKDISEYLKETDKGFFYNNFIVEQKK